MTEAIIPRWEWRVFAERFGAAERRSASLATAPPQVGDGRDVLGLRSETAIKVRDGLTGKMKPYRPPEAPTGLINVADHDSASPSATVACVERSRHRA